MIVYEDGGNRFLGEMVLEPKEEVLDGDNLHNVVVRAYENADIQYIAIRAHGERIYLDEAQIAALVKWLAEKEVIL